MKTWLTEQNFKIRLILVPTEDVLVELNDFKNTSPDDSVDNTRKVKLSEVESLNKIIFQVPRQVDMMVVTQPPSDYPDHVYLTDYLRNYLDRRLEMFRNLDIPPSKRTPR